MEFDNATSINVIDTDAAKATYGRWGFLAMPADFRRTTGRDFASATPAERAKFMSQWVRTLAARGTLAAIMGFDSGTDSEDDAESDAE